MATSMAAAPSEKRSKFYDPTAVAVSREDYDVFLKYYEVASASDISPFDFSVFTSLF